MRLSSWRRRLNKFYISRKEPKNRKKFTDCQSTNAHHLSPKDLMFTGHKIICTKEKVISTEKALVVLGICTVGGHHVAQSYELL